MKLAGIMRCDESLVRSRVSAGGAQPTLIAQVPPSRRERPAASAAPAARQAGSSGANRIEGRAGPLVAVIAQDGVDLFEAAAACQVFGAYRGAGVMRPERSPVELVSLDADAAAMSAGPCGQGPVLGLEDALDAEVLFVPSARAKSAGERSADRPKVPVGRAGSRELAEVLRSAVASGRRVVGVGSGVFTLARAGLLDGRTATTHADLAHRFREEFPGVELRAEALYIDEGPVLTGAGRAATLDLCLHIIATSFEPAEATRIAQRMLVGPYRSGRFGQRLDQVPANGVGTDQRISDLLAWMARNLHLDLSVDALANRVYMSRRSLTRRFRSATGTTPYAWIIGQRVHLARELLEQRSHLTVEDIAKRVGFANPGALRQHFQRQLGCTPTQYRQAARL